MLEWHGSIYKFRTVTSVDFFLLPIIVENESSEKGIVLEILSLNNTNILS